MIRFKAMLPAGLALVLALTANAADKPATPPAPVVVKTAADVLKRWVDAMGGEAAIRQNKTRLTKGSLEIPALSVNVTLTMLAKAPNKRVAIIEIPGVGEMKTICDGESAWRTNPQTGGLDEVRGEELVQEKLEADYWLLIELEKRFPKMELKPVQKVEGKDCHVVEASRGSGAPERFYFDIQTGLMVRRDAEAITPLGKLETETVFEDYREVSGVKVAHLVRRVRPEQTGFVFKTTEMKFNADLDDARFRKP